MRGAARGVPRAARLTKRADALWRPAKGAILSGRMAPFGTPKTARAAPLTCHCLSLLCRCCTRCAEECILKLSTAFDLACFLRPLPLCGGVSDRTHMSFRTRCAGAAERRQVAEGNETALHQRLSGYRRRPSRKPMETRLCRAVARTCVPEG